MKYFKTPLGPLAALPDDGSQDETITADMVPISEAQWQAMGAFANPVPPPPTVLEQIIALETSNPITHRTLREVILAMGLMVQQVTGKPASANLYYVRLATLNAQIDAMAASIRGQ